jgi:hypothetical protein
MVNAHDETYASTIAWHDIETIRATPTEVRYIPGDIFEFTCRLLNGRTRILQANEERPIKNLYDYKDAYGTGLARNWIIEVQNRNYIQINSTRNPNDPLNWYVSNGFIAFFTTNKFKYIDIDTIQHACPATWQFNRIANTQGLFGGIFELRNSANDIIKVNCGYNNGNSGLKMYINNELFRNYSHKIGFFNKLITNLNEWMR